jgi:acetyl-CoA C-acetyltransferase
MEQKVVVAGWGQITQPKELDGKAKDPMGLMTEASKRAAQSMASKDILSNLDGIMVVRTVSCHYKSPAKQLANKIGATPKFTNVSGIGGNSPQTLINIAGGMIARNELDSILVAGAEAYVQRDTGSKRVESALFRGIPEDYPGDDLIGSTPLENAHGIEHPMHGFPLFETALWAKSGLDLQSYLMRIGEMWSKFSKTASQNPYAWSKLVRTAEEIITIGPSNRPVAFPYTKYMNSFVTVDQGAAVILMSENAAKKHSQKNRQKVYFLGGGYAEDSQRFMIEKSDFTSSPPLKAAVDKALTRSCIPLEKIDCFDLYSCFPCAVSIAKKMVGISDDDPRSLTLTGGLGFFGGPGNNYNLHGIATLAQKISLGEKSNGLVTALGWFMHKHAAGVYSSEPFGGEFKDYDLQDQKNSLAGFDPVKIKNQITGKGTIETYTIIYSMDQTPSYAVIYGKTHDNFRFIARTQNHPDIFKELASKNMVGENVNIRFDRSVNMNIADLG